MAQDTWRRATRGGGLEGQSSISKTPVLMKIGHVGPFGSFRFSGLDVFTPLGFHMLWGEGTELRSGCADFHPRGV